MNPTILADRVALQTAVLVLPFARVDPDGTPWLRVPGAGIVPARCVSGLERNALEAAWREGIPAVAAMEGGDLKRPIVLGLLGPPSDRPAEAVVDGKRVVLTGQEEVTLRCGKASITLTRAGKILIKGDSVSSRATGVNRIRGGSVQIN
jgi:hypothetical protein